MNWGGRIIERKKTISILAGQSRKSMRQPRFLAEASFGQTEFALVLFGKLFSVGSTMGTSLPERDLEYLVSVEGELGDES